MWPTQGLYVTFLRYSKFVSEANAPSIALMGRCIVDAYGLHPHTSYQFMFVYIRELSMRLRAAITTKTKQANQAVYCWQFMNGIKVSRCCGTTLHAACFLRRACVLSCRLASCA